VDCFDGPKIVIPYANNFGLISINYYYIYKDFCHRSLAGISCLFSHVHPAVCLNSRVFC
jgi:hypothetical protein